jgi:ATP-dependent Lon protease
VATVDELLKHALVSPLTPIEWSEAEAEAAVRPSAGEEDRPGLLTH